MKTPLETLVDEFVAHPPKLGFDAVTPEDLASWQEILREKLRELSGISRMERDWQADLAVEHLGEQDMGDHVRESILLQTAPDYWMPLAVLRPKGDGPFVPVTAQHGHGRGMNDVPHLLEWADRGDFGTLIAPRGLVVESGANDPLFSRVRTLKAYETVKRAYRVAGASDRLDVDLFDGGHEWSGRKVWSQFANWL